MGTTEQYFSIQDIAKQWQLSTDLVRSLFREEPGVLRIERPAGRFKRIYTTLRIPQSVLSRVQTRLAAVR